MFYPDVNNDALQKEGKNPVFYWLPNYVHLARKDSSTDGDLMFNMIRFAGVQSEDSHVGVEGTREVAGGVLSFTTTSAPPADVMLRAQEEISERFMGKSDFFWGIRSNRKPFFRPVPIRSSVTSVSNLSPQADGTVPAVPADPAPAGPGGTRSSDSAPRSSLQNVVARSASAARYRSKTVPFRDLPNVKTRSQIDPWYWQMQGTGNASIDPSGQNAFVALVGAYPAAILYESFHGSYAPVFVQNELQMPFWMPSMELTITGKWERIFSHFSAQSKFKSPFGSADVTAELNNLRVSGGITVDIKLDETMPNADKLRDYIEKQTDLISQKFMEEAKAVIFAPAPEVEAAQASTGGGFFGWGGGLSLKYRRDKASVDLYYHETRQISYLQGHTISSSLEGMHEEIQDNPEAERKYFRTLYLDGWPRKLSRIIKPIGMDSDAVAFMSAQIGYPGIDGDLQWTGRPFQKSDPDDYSWNIGITQKEAADVENAPEGWEPDMTYVKRAIHMNEEPNPFEDQLRVVQMDENIIHLDPSPNGSPLNDITLELRADDATRIAVGPINLGVNLENASQVVEVTLRATDPDEKPINRFEPIKFSFKHTDQEESRFWAIYSSDMSVESYYEYQVRVIVKGSLFTKGMEWTGPWRQSNGNGPLMISVPTPEDSGVTVTRSFPVGGRQSAATPPPGVGDATLPPAGTSPARSGAPTPPSGDEQEVEDGVLEVSGYDFDIDETDPVPAVRNAPPSGDVQPPVNGVREADFHY
jgi:hypothetical protein